MLENSCILRSNYDAINDVLYLQFTPTPCRCYGDDDFSEDIVIRRDIETDEIVGLTIFDPKSRTRQREAELQQLGYHFNLTPLLSWEK